MKIFIIVYFLFTVNALVAQEIKVYTENADNNTVLVYADNNNYCTASIALKMKITNLSFSEGSKEIFVLPASTKKFKIGTLTPIKANKTFNLSFNYQYTLGDVTLTQYDKDFAYDLPFKKEGNFKVFQGYFGKASHQNEMALDFVMKEGTEVVAARDGIVVAVVQHHTSGCPSASCKDMNNYVLLYHTDGTFTQYVHLKFNGAAVKVGDSVQKNNLIGYSGNTGWSTGPHLHFVAYLAGFDAPRTIATRFRIQDGKKSELLQEGNSYSRNY